MINKHKRYNLIGYQQNFSYDANLRKASSTNGQLMILINSDKADCATKTFWINICNIHKVTWNMTNPKLAMSQALIVFNCLI